MAGVCDAIVGASSQIINVLARKERQLLQELADAAIPLWLAGVCAYRANVDEAEIAAAFSRIRIVDELLRDKAIIFVVAEGKPFAATLLSLPPSLGSRISSEIAAARPDVVDPDLAFN
jgi:hypothetical protein